MAFLYGVRSRGNFNPDESKPFRISRSKVDLFLECPRCFYMDQRLGIGRPSTFPLTLNIAVDELLKKEFDILREKKNPHPIMEKYKIDAVPFKHEKLELWREALRGGIEFVHPETNLSVRGGVDDVWEGKNGELIIVDYKATAKRDEITLDGDLGAQYKRQMEVYQWLFRQNGFTVSPVGYFVYVNGKKDAEKFDGKLEFDMLILPCEGNTDWIEPTLLKIKDCLLGSLPQPHENCSYCSYRKHAAGAATGDKKDLENKKKTKKMQVKQTFSDRVREVVRKIPKGKTLTYKQVAKLAGSPLAFRAVGSILSKNYDPKIPCHRVIREDGGMGGFNRGLKNKIAILKKEGALK